MWVSTPAGSYSIMIAWARARTRAAWISAAVRVVGIEVV
jgi:hypothetical protein